MKLRKTNGNDEHKENDEQSSEMCHSRETLTHREVALKGDTEKPDNSQQIDDRKQENIIPAKKESTCSEIDETEKTKEYKIPLQKANPQ